VTFPVNSRSRVILFLTALVMIAGCSSTPKPADTASNKEKEFSSTDEQIFVGDSVEMSYDPNVIMKRAESFFDKESYAEAIVEYKHFLDLHRNHILAPYAQYKIGISHFKQYRTVDRDPEPLNQSIQNFEKLLEGFPASRYETEAKETILICKEQLAQRHLMVGQFYLGRGSYLAAAHRFEKVIKEYPELESAGDAMFHLAKTYQNLGIEEWSQEWLIALVNEHPNNPYHKNGKKLLAKLQEKNPTLLASLPENTSVNETLPLTQSPEKTLSPNQESTLVSYAGILPTPSTPVPLNVTTTVTEPPSSHASCTIGTWCDSRSASVTTPSAQLPDSPKSCKTGEWC
jgi:outer membrane protein assembly factor BamD